MEFSNNKSVCSLSNASCSISAWTKWKKQLLLEETLKLLQSSQLNSPTCNNGRVLFFFNKWEELLVDYNIDWIPCHGSFIQRNAFFLYFLTHFIEFSHSVRLHPLHTPHQISFVWIWAIFHWRFTTSDNRLANVCLCVFFAFSQRISFHFYSISLKRN